MIPLRVLRTSALAGFQGWSSRSFRLATAALLFGMQSLIILIFHQYLLLLVGGVRLGARSLHFPGIRPMRREERGTWISRTG